MRGMKRGTVRTTRVLIIGFTAERVPSRTLAVFASLDLIVPQLCLARHVKIKGNEKRIAVGAPT